MHVKSSTAVFNKMDEKETLKEGTLSNESDNIKMTECGTSSEDVLQMESPVSEALVNNANWDTTETFPFLDKVGDDLKAFANLDLKSDLSVDALGKKIPIWSDMRKEIPILASFDKDPQSLRDSRQMRQDLVNLWENIPFLDSFSRNSPENSFQGHLPDQETNFEWTLNSDIQAQVSKTIQKYIPTDFDSGLGVVAKDTSGLGNLQEYFSVFNSENIDNEALINFKRKLKGRDISRFEGWRRNVPDTNKIIGDVPGLNALTRNIPGLEHLNIDQIKSRIEQVDDTVESLIGISPADWVSQIPGADLMGFGGNEDGDGSSSGDSNDFESVFSDLRSIGGDVVEIITDSKQFFTQLGALVGVFGTLVNTGSNVIDSYNNGKVIASIFNIILLVSVQIPTITAMLFVFLKDKIHVSWTGFMKVKEDLKELMEDLDSLMGSDDDDDKEDEDDLEFKDPGDTEFLHTSTDNDTKISDVPTEEDVFLPRIVDHNQMKQKDAEVQILPETDVHLSCREENNFAKKAPAFQLHSKKDDNKELAAVKQECSPQAVLKRKTDDSTPILADTADTFKRSKKKKNSKKKRPARYDKQRGVTQGSKSMEDNEMVQGISESPKILALSENIFLKDKSKVTSFHCSTEFQSVVSLDESTTESVFDNNLHKSIVTVRESDGLEGTIPYANPSCKPFFSNKEFELQISNDSFNSKSDVHKDIFRQQVTDDGFDFKSVILNDRFKPLSCDDKFRAEFSDVRFKPGSSGHRFQSVSSDDRFKPVSSKARFKPVSSDNSFKHVSSDDRFKPVSSKARFKPVSSDNSFKHVSSDDRFNPVSSGDRFKSVSSYDKFKPVSYEDRFKPVSSEDRFKSVSSDDKLKPVSTEDRFKQGSSDEECKPLVHLEELTPVVSHKERKSQTVSLAPNDGFQTVVRKRRRKVMESQKHSVQNPMKWDAEQLKEHYEEKRFPQGNRHRLCQNDSGPYSFHGPLTFQSYYNTCRPKEKSSSSKQTIVDLDDLHENLADWKDKRQSVSLLDGQAVMEKPCLQKKVGNFVGKN